MATLIDRIKVLEEMLGIMFQQGQESAYYDDKIEIGAMTYSDVEYENGKSEGMDIAYNMIADAPEIKAIPIEWLHSIMKKQLIFAMESEMEGTTTVKDGFIHCVSGALACQVLANVIELWEKENEENI